TLSPPSYLLSFIYFKHSHPPQIYTLSLHDALPIYITPKDPGNAVKKLSLRFAGLALSKMIVIDSNGQNSTFDFNLVQYNTPLARSEEHTSELQSLTNIVCRLLLEKKKKHQKYKYQT